MNRLIVFVLIVLSLFFLQSFANDKLGYDYENTFSIPVQLVVLDEISTKDGIIEGEKIRLKVKKNIFYKHQLLVKKDTIATARVETFLTKGMNGFPAEIMLDNFEVEGLSSSKILCNYTKRGFSFVFLVYPIKWALTPIPFAGSLTNFIKGCHATIESGDVITIEYFPKWK